MIAFMTAKEAMLLNLEETRKRSRLIFDAIPSEHILWKPDETAMTLIETVRHIYECDDWFRQIILHNVKAEDFASDFESRPYISIQDEINFGTPYREELITLVKSYSDDDLSTVQIIRPKWKKSLDEFLLHVAYHEAYHAGQLQFFLRMVDVPRPNVWV
jgi:uncharacterized damage-inducible protein DinB